MARLQRDVDVEEARWTDAHRMEVDRRIHSYLVAARKAEQDGDAPSEDWLASYLQRLRKKSGTGYARRIAGYIAHHLRRCNAPVVTESAVVQNVLREQDRIDPLSVDLEIANAQNIDSLAQEFADNAYSATTYVSYASHAKEWLAWCASSGTDPLDGSVEELVTYLELLGERMQSGTVNNRKNAIGHYLRKNGAADITRDRAVKRVIQGLANVKAPKHIHAATAHDRLTLLSSLEERGMGIRDRVILLILAFTSLPYERMTLIDIEHVTVAAGGVAIASLNADPPFFIGTHHERDLDIVFWMSRLLDLLPRKGPLFRPALQREFRFAEERVSLVCLTTAVRRIANDTGVGGADLAERLRLLFAAETHGKVSEIVRARYANKRHLPAHVVRESPSRFDASRRKRRTVPEQNRLL